jgi:HSP20 family molecular chaperone IbpA
MKTEKEWRYCPKCGYRRGDMFGSMFSSVFSKMRKEMERTERGMGRLFERDMEVFDLSPWFRAVPKKGRSCFSIKITQSGREPPRVSVKTLGGVDREELQRQIREQLGARGKLKEKQLVHRAGHAPREEKPRPMPAPKTTEEPHTEVRRLDSKVVVDLSVPGVRSIDDIEVKELESSVEVKAMAGDKAYFKILTKPEQYRLTNKSFDNGLLHLEFS